MNSNGKLEIKRTERTALILLFVYVVVLPDLMAADTYDLQFSRFFGGSGWEYTRDAATDDSGNIYIAGGTTSPGSMFTHSYGSLGGPTDVLVAKFTSDGQLVWSTVVGGSGNGDDYAYGLEVDSQGYVYVTGRAAPGFPTTPGAMQRTFQGVSGGHGDQNAFVLKLAPGGTLVFSTYFGTGAANRDLDLDQNGNIYVVHRWTPNAGQKPLPSSWFTNAYQKIPRGGNEGAVAKMSSDGSQVVWATYIGGSGDESPASTIRVASNGEVYYCCVTTSDDIPTTANAYDRSLNGSNDAYVAKFSNDGSTLLSGTYFGGSGSDFIANCHNMDIDSQGNVFIVGESTSPDLPTTIGVVQPSYAGAARGAWEETSDYFVAKISSNGNELLACTYYGGSRGERTVEGVDVDSSGNVYFSGGTFSTDFPVTSHAHQSSWGGSHDGILVKLSSDLTQALYATYMGDSGERSFRCCTTDGDFSFIGSGPADSTWPVLNSPLFGGGATDVILVKFALPAPVADLNLDGYVDFRDFSELAVYWMQNESAVDICPSPHGDSMVDFKDLAVLTKYWLMLPGIVAYWKLDETEGSTAYDSIAQNNGILNGSPSWEPTGGAINGALQFDGIDDYVSTEFIRDPADGPFSVFVWIRGGAPGQVVLSQTDAANWVCMDSVQGCLMTELKNPGRGIPLVSQTCVTDGSWHRIGFVWDGLYRQLYVDGTEVAMDVEPLSEVESAEGGLYFGAGSTLAPGTFFSGLIDDVRIYNRAVNP